MDAIRISAEWERQLKVVSEFAYLPSSINFKSLQKTGDETEDDDRWKDEP